MPSMPENMDSAPQQETPSGAMGDYLRPDGSFDIDAALADYEKFLQSVPKRNRILLQAALGGAEYQQTSKPTKIFAYDPKRDVILFNPNHPYFYDYDFRVVNTHELGHRIDRWFVHSAEQPSFMTAIQDAKTIFDKSPDLFIQFCEENDEEGFLSDIMSAICKGEYQFDFGHTASYWTSKNQAKEIFTNLHGLETYNEVETLTFLKNHFHDLMEAFSGLEFLV